jgi:hypothetical protein
MAEQFRIAQRPRLQAGTRAPQETVQAQPQNWTDGRYGVAPDPELAGLVQGLSALNPALARFGQQKQQEQAQQDALEGAAAAQRADLSVVSSDPGSFLPPAYSREFGVAMKQGMARRLGVQARDAALAEYHDKKDDPNFEAKSWLEGRRAALVGSVGDPEMAKTIGADFMSFEANLLGDIEKERLVRRDEQRASMAHTAMQEDYGPSMRPDEWFERYQTKTLPFLEGLGFDKKQAAAMLLARIDSASAQFEGVPELYDTMLNFKDAEGHTLEARNPQLAAAIRQKRAHAADQQDKRLLEDSKEHRAVTLAGYQSDLDMQPESITMERLLGDFTPYGAIRTPEQFASLWAQAQDAQRKLSAAKSAEVAMMGGNLWHFKDDVQRKALDAQLGPTLQRMVEAVNAGQPADVASIAHRLMQQHAESGASVTYDPLVNFIEKGVGREHSDAGPTPMFRAAVALYQSLKNEPLYRARYFKEDETTVIEQFLAGSQTGGDEKGAYMDAYRAISPEGKKLAAQVTGTKEFQEKSAKLAKRYVEGSSPWGWIGGNGRPSNGGALQVYAGREAALYLQRNPNASEEQIETFLKGRMADNWVLDTTSQLAVKVPAGKGGTKVQEAISGFTKAMAEKLQLSARSDGEWTVELSPVDEKGRYDVFVSSGTAKELKGSVTIDDMVGLEANKRNLSDAERGQLAAYRSALNKGGELPSIDPAVIAKAEAIGAIKGDERRALSERAQKVALDRVNAVPQIAFGKPSAEGVAFNPAKQAVKVDPKLTSRIAAQFAQNPTGSAYNNHAGLAASLITMREGVVLAAYTDPNPDAGRNIGTGYNLNANAHNVDADLKRVGVPAEKIEGVKNGTVALTPDQAQRLTQVAMPRYEKLARDAAEKTAAGLWDRMVPAQRAVMIDVAWQVGDPEKFQKAWAALAAGDSAKFAEETKVFYKDKDGERREDVRAGSLRASMLAGVGAWNAVVNRYGSTPSSKLQVAASQ